MPSIGQENLETVMIDFFGALRRGDFDVAAALLDPNIAWQGLREEWVCHGREEGARDLPLGARAAPRGRRARVQPAAAIGSCWAPCGVPQLGSE
jgi:hypothetical protein